MKFKLMKLKINKKLKKYILMITGIICLIAFFMMLVISNIEEEFVVPFNISNITIVSTAEGIDVEGENKWNLSITQNNDIYVFFEKNEEYREDVVIEKVIIENIKIKNENKYGELVSYMPSSISGRVFTYEEQYKVDKKLEFNGAEDQNIQMLEIDNTGGNILFRISNMNLGTYSSDEDEEIVHDGFLISKLDLVFGDILFDVEFDVVIQTKNWKYSTTIEETLPIEGLMDNGIGSIEMNNLDNLIFKRSK